MSNSEYEKILSVVRRALESFNEQLPADRKLVGRPETKLVGSPDLDSAEIVNLLVAIEQQVEQDLEISVTLFESIDRFVNVEALITFLGEKVGSADN
jgi:acyl carrier protein